ncbi:MAG: apolipoprotein N-acyltransferase [Leptospirales bacterium]
MRLLTEPAFFREWKRSADSSPTPAPPDYHFRIFQTARTRVTLCIMTTPNETPLSPPPAGIFRFAPPILFLGAGTGFGLLFDTKALLVPDFTLIFPLLLPFFLVRPRTLRGGFLEGLLFGLAANMIGIHWITVSMENYGHIPVPLSLAGLSIFSLYLALYPALFRALSLRMGFWRAGTNRLALRSLWMAPALWVLCESGKTEILTGFPWNPLGSLLFGHPFLVLPARIIGTTGLSFLVVLETVLLSMALLTLSEGLRARALPVTLLPAGFIALWLLWGSTLEQAPSASPTLRVSLVQANIPPDQKWSAENLRKNLALYLALSQQGAGSGARLLVWPETALPALYNSPGTHLASTLSPLLSPGSFLLTGAIGEKPDASSPIGLSFTNAAVLYGPDGTLRADYTKRHLVPFGEFLPLPALFGWLRPMLGVSGDMARGALPGRFPLPEGGGTFSPLICYEALYPSLSREDLGNGHLLAVISDDAWFGDTSAPWQLFRESGMRAAENGVYLVRAANTGLSGIVAPDTTVLRSGPLFRKAVITETTPLPVGQTFYREHGEWVLRLSLSGLLFFLALSPLLEKRPPDAPLYGPDSSAG